MDEKLMQYLQEQFDKIEKRFDEVDKHFDKVGDRIVEVELQIDKLGFFTSKLEQRFDKIEDRLNEYDAHLLKTNGQVMSNSEMASIIRSHEKRISDLETEVKIIKKAIRNMGY